MPPTYNSTYFMIWPCYIECGDTMNKHLIEAFIILLVIMIGVSLVSEVNDVNARKQTIEKFDEKISNNEEVENGEMDEVEIEEDSSNLLSNINAHIATFIVDGLNKILKLGLSFIDGATGN